MGSLPEPTRERGEIDLAHEPAFALGRLHVSPPTREIGRGGVTETVEPRVMQALVCLAGAEGRVVSRDDLIRLCWGGRIVGEDAINRCIAKVRQVAERDDPPAFVIETVPRVGYRLKRTEPVPEPVREIPVAEIAPAESAPPPPAADASPTEAAPPGFDRHHRWRSAALAVLAAMIVAGILVWRGPREPVEPPPSIRSVAVLPIENLTGDSSLDRAADTLTEDVIYVLGRSGTRSVAPRNATFAFKGKPVDERRLGSELHVRHVVAASLRSAAPGYRLNYQIVDTVTGKVVGSQDFGRAPADGAFPEHQLALTLFQTIASVLQKRWLDEETRRPADDSDPENVLARFVDLWQHHRREDIAAAERLIETAKRVIPKDSNLMAEMLSDACWFYSEDLIRSGYFASPEQRTAWAEAALEYSKEASEVRPNLTYPHSCRAEVFGQLERWDEGIAEARHVVDTFPMTSNGYEALARLEFARGAFQDSLRDYMEVQTRLANDDFRGEIGLTHLFLNETDAAIASLREREVADPTDTLAPFFLAAALELSGRHAEAVDAAEIYNKLKTDDGIWATLAVSHEPAFLGEAEAVRRALHAAGLDEPAHAATLMEAQRRPSPAPTRDSVDERR